MNIVVVGLGSMGKRRIRLIKKYDSNIEIYGVDNNQERREECEKKYNIEAYSSLNDLFDKIKINCAFVCTAPLSHSKIITQCLERKIHVFTELNLVSDEYDKNITLSKKNGVVLFMSSTFLYREEINKIRSLINEADCLLNYTYHVGQYLPDWHPWENYNNFFVGNKRSNGCRELFAIELPWLIDVFGDIIKIDVVKSKMSNLNINYNDNYLVMVQHATGHKGVFIVDVVSRKAVRNLEIFGEKLFLQWDGSPEGLKIFDYHKKEEKTIQLYDKIDQLEQYSSFIVENAYFNEIVSFFETVNGNNEPIYSFEKDKSILKIIDEIEA
ncbi:Gfo/Idh/MocA family protein [Anaerophilus nitritogenes]|uniref:Gfo/Idh/MocA family protein n=1 Tax=Anaerophilus nitritogenes TaxID=2498136 RepID=UPI00101CD117|nr:Gfo/Idh/MocA family oxidoreductase [Anaerophilus nitritogenes]